MNWDDYQPFDPRLDRPLHEVSRREAQAAFAYLMESREERLAELQKLAEANDVDHHDLQQLNDWFVRSVEANEEQPNRLSNRWYSVVNDLALHIGERLGRDSDGAIHWHLLTRRKADLSYQRHVLVGFSGVTNPEFHVEPDLLIGT